ncbi:hypothetical protein Bpfe_021543, partial [Biomphalaria pfeifferi]
NCNRDYKSYNIASGSAININTKPGLVNMAIRSNLSIEVLRDCSTCERSADVQMLWHPIVWLHSSRFTGHLVSRRC